MARKIRELLDKRAANIHQAREILDKAESENRGLTAEDESRYNALMDEAGTLKLDMDRLDKLEEAERSLEQTAGANSDNQEARRMDPGSGENRNLGPRETDEYRSAFNAYLVGGVNRLNANQMRALQADSDPSGGFLMAPIAMVNALIASVKNLVFIRQWATVYTVTDADGLGAPSLDADPADPTWTSELGIGTEDATMAFGKRELKPHPLAKSIKVSRKLLMKVPSVESLINDRMSYKFATVHENAYINGSGAGQPLGVFTANAQGISVSRDVSAGNTATEIRFDGLTECKYSLKPQYWPRAKWLFHRDGCKQIAKLKDGEGQYVWRESVRVGEPDRLLGFPVFMSEYAPNTFSTGLYVGILGDFSQYWIVDSLSLEVQRLQELYATANQVGYIFRQESDGQPVLEEAFSRVKLG